MSHWVGVSGVHWIDSGSNLVPVLGLSHSAKVLGYTKSSCPLLGVHRPLWCGRASGSHQGEADIVHQAQADPDLSV